MSERIPVSFIATAQPDLARSFYSDVIGLTLLEVPPFALVYEDKGQILRVQIVDALSPPPYTVHGWQVSGFKDPCGNILSLTEFS